MTQKLIYPWLWAFLCLWFSCVSLFAQEEKEDLLTNLMMGQPNKFRHVLLEPDTYEVQIIYTQVYRDSLNRPFLKDYTYHLNPKASFNPASIVKLPLSILALEKINQIKVDGVNKYTRMGTEATGKCQVNIIADNPKDKDYPSLARYIEQMLLVSDNDAYSRVYEFLGQSYIHQKLNEKKYPLTRIVRRFDDKCDSLDNRNTNRIRFYDEACKPIYTQEAQSNKEAFIPPLGQVKKGLGYVNNSWQRINQPMDFTYSNYVSLRDIHTMLVSVMMPEIMPKEKKNDLKEEDYVFLRRCLGAYPREALMNKYPLQKGYNDSYKKYLYFGRTANPPVNMRVFNIVGWWAGYLTDSAYFVDFENNVEFFLSAVIYVNKNQWFDYNFEYNDIGFPFMANLGKLVYEYEKQRKKDYVPDLGGLKGLFK